MSTDTLIAGSRLYGDMGKYRVLARIATGGTATVYHAVDCERKREVALKILAPQMAARSSVLERFYREARHAARLRHENLVTVHEFGQIQGLHYLAMEFVEGIDLLEYSFRRGPLDPAEARRLIAQGCRALAYIHSLGIIHRDVKPSNLLLTDKAGVAVVKLTDLGLARASDGEDFRVTQEGLTVGTVDYMAPEQARDSCLTDIRSDLYALGSTWYHLLAGHGPFAEGSIGERLYQLFNEPPRDVRQLNPRVGPADAAVLNRLLAKEPQDRYQTPNELLAELATLPDTSTPAPLGEPSPCSPSLTAPCTGVKRIPLTPASSMETAHNHIVADTQCDELPAEDFSPAEPVRARRVSEGRSSRTDAAGSDPAPLSPAVATFARARQVLASGDVEYGLELLDECCRLDPGNVLYRDALRSAVKGRERSSLRSLVGGWIARLNLKLALWAHRDREALAYGEKVLRAYPGHRGTQRDMARAAERLGETILTIWLLRQVSADCPRDRRILDDLARLSAKPAPPRSVLRR